MQDQDFQNSSQPNEESVHSSLIHNNSFFSGISFSIQRLIFVTAFSGVLILFLVSFFIIRYNEKKSSAAYFESISHLKKEQLENYFQTLSFKVDDFVNNSRIEPAFDEFKSAFSGINSEYNSNLTKTTEGINEFYKNFAKSLNEKTALNFNAEQLVPIDEKSIILQSLYISGNIYPFGQKGKLDNAGDNSSYSSVHKAYHVVFANFISAIGAEDLLLIDQENGDIVYSYQKNNDFSTNISNGPYSSSALATVFNEAIAKPGLVFSDISLYTPALMKPVVFGAISTENHKAVIAFRISTDRITNLLNDYGISGNFFSSSSIYLTGDDFFIRTDDHRLKNSEKRYIKKLAGSGINRQKLSMIDSLNTCATLVSLPAEVFSKAALGYTEVKVFKNAFDEKVLGSIVPVSILDNKMYLIVQGNLKYVFHGSFLLLKWGIPLILLLIFIVLIIGWKRGEHFSKKLKNIANAVKSLSFGGTVNFPLNGDENEINDTLQNLNQLSSKLEKATDFVTNVASGNVSSDFTAFSDNDIFSNALNKVRASFAEIKIKEEIRIVEDNIRNWSTSGVAKFNDLLHLHNDDIKNFTFIILKELIEYLSAVQGGFFMLEEEEGGEKLINLITGYAYDRRKYNQKQIRIGEGLLGTCVLEKKFIYLRDIPDEYVEITSGLGHANPKNLLIVPLIYDNEVTGLIELASFNELKKYEIEFVEKVAESIANTLHSVQLNERTRQLLQQSNERTEELSAQEEEMRQNLEELKATQEEMARIKDEDERKEKIRREKEQEFLLQLQKNNEEMQKKQEQLEWEKLMFNTLMDSLSERVTFKDLESRYIRINKRKSIALGLKDISEVIGKNDFDVFGGEHFEKVIEDEKKMIRSGVAIYDKEEIISFKDGTSAWGSTSRIPLKNESGEICGILVMTRDITTCKNNELELEVHNKLFDEITDSQSVLIYRLDPKGLIIKAKGRLLDMMGIIENDIVNKGFSDIFTDAGKFFENDIPEEGFSFIQRIKNKDYRHIIFENKTLSGGFSGVAFILNNTGEKTE